MIALLLVACTPEPTLWISTETLPGGRVGFDYEEALSVEDSEGKARWSLVDGALPEGLELSDDGVLVGTVARSGRYAFTVAVKDALGTDELDLDLAVPDVLLMSGFGPFSGYPVNPSIEALRDFDQAFIRELDVRVVELPVTWAGAWPPLRAAIEDLHPTLVIGTGVADTDAMRFERTAHNEQLGRDVDNERPPDGEVVPGGPDTLDTALPIEQMAAAEEAGGYVTMMSEDAGNYLCNHVFYQLMYHRVYVSQEPYVTGFVHVPPAPSEAFEIADITGAHLLGIEALTAWMGTDEGLARTRPGTTVAPTYRGR